MKTGSYIPFKSQGFFCRWVYSCVYIYLIYVCTSIAYKKMPFKCRQGIYFFQTSSCDRVNTRHTYILRIHRVVYEQTHTHKMRKTWRFKCNFLLNIINFFHCSRVFFDYFFFIEIRKFWSFCLPAYLIAYCESVNILCVQKRKTTIKLKSFSFLNMWLIPFIIKNLEVYNL